MRVLVIGGTGYIGRHVVGRLMKRGHDVAVFHRGRTECGTAEGVQHILGDRRRLWESSDVLRRFAPEVLLDVIPMNKDDARDVMGTFRDVARRVVAISSQDVYRAYDRVTGRDPGPPDSVPLTEEAPLRDRLYPYKREGVDNYEKIHVERVVMGDPDLPGTVLRLPAVYGPGDHRHRLLEYVKRMDDGRDVLVAEGMASWRWTHGYVEDVAGAVVLAAEDERAESRVYNVGEAEPLSWAGWVRAIGEAAGWGGEVVFVPDDRLPGHLDWGLDTRQHWVADTTRIRRELGYAEAVQRDEALRTSVEWERACPPGNLDPASFDYAAEDAVLGMRGLRRRRSGSPNV